MENRNSTSALNARNHSSARAVILEGLGRSTTRIVFFFKQKTAYEISVRDWSSDVCSSDLSLVVASKLLYTFLAYAISSEFNAIFNGWMTMKNKLDDFIWGFVHEVDVGQLLHARDKGEGITGHIERI